MKKNQAPFPNRILHEREVMREHLLHMERLKRIQGVMQFEEPRKAQTPQRKIKELEKRNEIQRGNRMLLKKMLNIDLHPS